MKILGLILLSICFTACQPPGESVKASIERKSQETAKLCIDKGGVPIYNSWQDYVIRCDFPFPSTAK